MRLRGRQNKHYMGRRLLQRLQQRIKSFCSQHMHFINNIHFTADFGRRIFHLVPEIAYFFNAPVRRCVNLLHIHDIPRGDPQTGWAFIARLSAFAALAIDCFGEHFGGTCLACTPRSTEQIGM
ncbi:hypothetical protein D3C75_950050 [compost metagenome]